MTPAPASGRQRIGIALSFIEAVMFGLMAAFHLGFELRLGDTTLSEPLLIPSAIIEAMLALALLVALIVPGGGAARAARLVAAQILVVILLFVGQVALLRASALASMRDEIFYSVTLVFALISIVLSAAFPRAPETVA